MAVGGFPIPPWLVARPAEFATAHEAGLRSGIAAAHIWAQANEERARLEQSAKRQDMEAQLERERLQEKSVYEAQKLAADVAYNKAALEQSKARIEQTQANAAAAAQRFAAKQESDRRRMMMANALATRRMALSRAGQESRLALSEDAQDIRRTHEAEVERHNRAVEAKSKGTDMDAAMAAYVKSRQEEPSGPGLLSRIGTGIKDLFGGTPAAPAQKPGNSPHAEGSYVRNKKDGKLYQIKNGLPVLVDDSAADEEEPGPPTDREGDEE